VVELIWAFPDRFSIGRSGLISGQAWLYLLISLVLLCCTLPGPLRAVDIKFDYNECDSIDDAGMIDNNPTTNQGSANSGYIGFRGGLCSNPGYTTWLKPPLPTGYDTCSELVIVLRISYDGMSDRVDTISAGWCTRSPVESQISWDSAKSGDAWTTDGGDYQKNGFVPSGGGWRLGGSEGTGSVCSLKVAHAGVDSVMQGLKANNGYILFTHNWESGRLVCPDSSTVSAYLYFRLCEHTICDSCEVEYIYKNVGTLPDAGGSHRRRKVLITSNQGAEYEMSWSHFLGVLPDDKFNGAGRFSRYQKGQRIRGHAGPPAP